MIAWMGPGFYRAGFALDIVLALVVIVVGWRRAPVEALYVPPLLGSPVVPEE